MGVLAMSRVRGSLFAAKPQILLRISGGSFLKTGNIPSSVAIVEQSVEQCEGFVFRAIVDVVLGEWRSRLDMTWSCWRG